jgi:hypothetical protein
MHLKLYLNLEFLFYGVKNHSCHLYQMIMFNYHKLKIINVYNLNF